MRPVVESISERAILVDGIHNVQVYFLGAAHTKGDLVVYLPTEKILFAGDLAAERAAARSCSRRTWIRAAGSALLTRSHGSAEKMVPGHGDIGPETGLIDSLAYVQRRRRARQEVRRTATSPTRRSTSQIRAPENKIENVTVTDTHIANVKAAVKACASAPR